HLHGVFAADRPSERDAGRGTEGADVDARRGEGRRRGGHREVAGGDQLAAGAMPCTLAMTGCGSVVIVIIMRLQRANSASTSGTLPIARISLRSCPAQNPRPLAASTTTRIVESAARRSKVDCSSSMSALESALNWPGRLSVTVATPSFVSVSSRASVCVVAFDVMCVPLSVWISDLSTTRSAPAPPTSGTPSERNAARDQPVLVRLPFETLAKV